MHKEKDGWQQFLHLCRNVEDEKRLSSLFDFLLTPEERAKFATRCQIITALLDEQKTQREVAKTLRVSISKITRGSNELKRISPKLKSYLHKTLLN